MLCLHFRFREELFGKSFVNSVFFVYFSVSEMTENSVSKKSCLIKILCHSPVAISLHCSTWNILVAIGRGVELKLLIEIAH